MLVLFTIFTHILSKLIMSIFYFFFILMLSWSVINNIITFKNYITNIALMQILFMSSSEELEYIFIEFGWIFSKWSMATVFYYFKPLVRNFVIFICIIC